MSELRDAIANRLDRPFDYCSAEELSDFILAAPELQAIRKALYELGSTPTYLATYDLPPSVVAWVMDGQP